MFVDGLGRRLEVILLDRCDGAGAQQWIRASLRGVLLGHGYYRRMADALALVDVDTLVEVLPMHTSGASHEPQSRRGGRRHRARRSAPTDTQR